MVIVVCLQCFKFRISIIYCSSFELNKSNQVKKLMLVPKCVFIYKFSDHLHYTLFLLHLLVKANFMTYLYNIIEKNPDLMYIKRKLLILWDS